MRERQDMTASLGYHTFTIYMKLTIEESLELRRAFEQYSDVYYVKNYQDKIEYECKDEFLRNLLRSSPRYYNFRYRRRCKGYTLPMDKGLKWTLRHRKSSPSFLIDPSSDEVDKPCSIKATINPKTLLGHLEYISAADSSCIKDLIEVFNYEARKISPILRDFNSYSLNRNDYCINFDIRNLGIGCYPEVYMMLFKRGDIPHRFKEFMEYKENDTSHRKKSDADSFYLTNNSLHINCYNKYAQLKKEYPETPNLEDYRYIIRFEIQCKYLKVQYLQRRIGDCKDFVSKMMKLLSNDFCTGILTYYYYKTIGKGDYYTLDGARDIVKSMNYNQNKEDRLIGALELVNQCRGVYKARISLSGKGLADFQKSINELGDIGVNPVTIPRELKIKFLPNLMKTYLDQREKEETGWEKYRLKCLHDQKNEMEK